MKLEVGKKYVVRNRALTEIKWVRVDAIRAEEKLPVACTASFDNGSLIPFEFRKVGKFYNYNGKEDYDLVHEYEEPKLELTENDIGKIAVFNDGSKHLITGYCTGDLFHFFLINCYSYTKEGKGIVSEAQVIEVIPVGT